MPNVECGFIVEIYGIKLCSECSVVIDRGNRAPSPDGERAGVFFLERIEWARFAIFAPI